MNDEKKTPFPDASYFLNEHGMVIADKLKEYEAAQAAEEKKKSDK